MAPSPKKVPDNFHSVTPHLVVKGAKNAIAFYKKAFGATGEDCMTMPGAPDQVMHAQIRIGDSMIMLADEFSGCSEGPDGSGATPVTLHLYVEDADAVFAQAIAAGATVGMPLADMFWGDRYGQVIDPFGHRWSIATHMRDYTPEEMAKGAEEMFAAHAAQQG
ncbi:VOC family protein [Thalassobaculum sp.]|uniref:VOC family protein n=1 Tax=Thalassobaculum sp. TaxID=2022740 RepID=UPI0032F043D8